MLPKSFLKNVLRHPDWHEVRKMYGVGSKRSIWSEAVCHFILDDCDSDQRLNDEIFKIYRQLCDDHEDIFLDASDNIDFMLISDDLVAFLERVPGFFSCLKSGINLPSESAEMMKKPRNPDLPRLIFELENVRRTGWTRVIPAFYPEAETANDVETVAVHSIKTAILASALAEKDTVPAFGMGLCHDMAEVLIGDLTPYQVKSVSDKHDAERHAFDSLLTGLNPHHAEILKASFTAYLDNRTPLAHIVHIADKLDMALQALAYEQRFHIDLHEFYESAEESIKSNWIPLRSLYQ